MPYEGSHLNNRPEVDQSVPNEPAEIEETELSETGEKKKADIFLRLENQLSPRKRVLYDEFVETIGGSYGKLTKWLVELLIEKDENGLDFPFLEKALGLCMGRLIAEADKAAPITRGKFIRQYVREKVSELHKEAVRSGLSSDPRVATFQPSYKTRAKGWHHKKIGHT